MINNKIYELIKHMCTYPKGLENLSEEDKLKVVYMIKHFENFRNQHIGQTSINVGQLLLVCKSFEDGFEAGLNFRNNKEQNDN